MRRATLRMTLESSTTKHVFISPHSALRGPSRCDFRLAHILHIRVTLMPPRRLGAEIEHPVDVEHDQKLSVEPEHAGGQRAPACGRD